MSIDLSTLNDLGLSSFNGAKPSNDKLGQEQFLKLMTTQLTNQNPLEPMDNGNFLAQIAQFGTVSGIQDLQKSFSEFSASISSDQALQAASLVGRQIIAPGNEGLLAAGGEIKGEIVMPSGSTDVKLKVIDSSTGEVVRNLDLGSQSAGATPFIWDGLGEDGIYANPGIYKIQAEANIGGEMVGLETRMNSTVESVTMANNLHGLLINLVGLGPIEFNEINQIL